MFDRMLEGQFVLRLLAAAAAGVVMGLPFRARPGGIRVHVLVTMGATFFCLTAEHLAAGKPDALLRVVQGIASGIGFVGAATVIRKGAAVEGINTAASIWISAAIGCEAGLGDALTAIVIAAAVTLILEGVGRAERALHFPRRQRAAGERTGAGGSGAEGGQPTHA